MRRLAPFIAVLVLAGCGGTTDDLPSGLARSIPIGLAANVDGAADVAAEIEAVHRTGAQWLREDLEWSAVQPRRGTFDWSSFDTIVGESAERGIHVLPILDSTPCWAARPGVPEADCFKTAPVDDADFAAFVRAAVARYGPAGSFWKQHSGLDGSLAIETWEVWNEPYLFSGLLPVSAARYASLFQAAADAGRGQSAKTKWLFAATASAQRADGSTYDWLPAVADAAPDLAPEIDALAIHVYPRVSSDGEMNATRGTKAVLATFEKEFGVAKPAWITELGFSACDPDTGANPCVPGDNRREREINKGQLMAEAIDQFRRTTFTDAVFIFTLREYDEAFHGEVGLLGVDGEPVPAYAAFQRAATNDDAR